MNKTTVVNLYKAQYDVYIGRAGKGQNGYFGNPFPLKQGEDRGSSIDKYTAYFEERMDKDPEFALRILELKGKVLGCFCKPNRCHGDVIAEYLNNL